MGSLYRCAERGQVFHFSWSRLPRLASAFDHCSQRAPICQSPCVHVAKCKTCPPTALHADQTEAVGLLLRAAPTPVQVARINDRVFLVNASLGLYPELLEDREAYKARFGRSRWVAFVAACATLLRAQRRLRLHIEMGGTARDVQTLTLFVGNNRLQLQQVGAEPEDTLAGTPGAGSMAALILRPIGTLSMIRLMLHGAMGTLGEAQSVERFEFHHMVVRPTLAPGRRLVKVAFDGEVRRMRAPLDFRVLEKPLYLLMPPRDGLTELRPAGA